MNLWDWIVWLDREFRSWPRWALITFICIDLLVIAGFTRLIVGSLS